jgi:predicted transcriptional regulator
VYFWKWLGLGRYRGTLDIIADILQVVKCKAKKTRIMYQANLSYKALQRYLPQIVGASLVDYEDETKSYILTDKGSDYLNVYQRYTEANKNVENHMKEVFSEKKSLEMLFPDGK